MKHFKLDSRCQQAAAGSDWKNTIHSAFPTTRWWVLLRAHVNRKLLFLGQRAWKWNDPSPAAPMILEYSLSTYTHHAGHPRCMLLLLRGPFCNTPGKSNGLAPTFTNCSNCPAMTIPIKCRSWTWLNHGWDSAGVNRPCSKHSSRHSGAPVEEPAGTEGIQQNAARGEVTWAFKAWWLPCWPTIIGLKFSTKGGTLMGKCRKYLHWVGFYSQDGNEQDRQKCLTWNVKVRYYPVWGQHKIAMTHSHLCTKRHM